MLGRTHYKVGIAVYIVLTIAFSTSGINLLKIMNSNFNITIMGIFAAAIGGLFPDVDSKHSLVNQKNPLSKIILKTMEVTGALANFLFVGVFIILIFGIIFALTQHLKLSKEIYVMALLVGLLFLSFSVMRKFYKFVSINIVHIVYIIIGTTIVAYNFLYVNDIGIYLIAILLMIMTFFKHRTFTHSIEAWLAFSFGAIHIASKFHHTDVGVAFSLGYFSHLYLADFLTVEGVSISFLFYTLHKKRIIKNKFFKTIISLLGKKHSLKLMKTGSDAGNRFELVYTVIWALLAVGSFLLTTQVI